MSSLFNACKRMLAAALVGAASTAAVANPVVWSLDQVKFVDGATASGSFTYDADTNSYSNWHVETTAGMLAGFTYDTANSISAFTSAHHLTMLWTNSAHYLTLDFAGDLSNAGGQVAIRAPGGWTALDGSYECNNCSPYRFIESGSVVAQALPEPASLALVAGALGIAGFASRRRRG